MKAAAATFLRRGPRSFAGQIALFGIGAILVVQIAYAVHASREQAEFVARAVAAQSQAVAGNLAAVVAPSLAAGDLGRAEQTILRALQFRDLLAIQILDAEGRALADVERGGDGSQGVRSGRTFAPPPAPDAGAVWQAVEAGGRAGWVRVEYSLDRAREANARLRRNYLVDSLAGMLFTLLAAFAFLRRPLLDMRRATEFAVRLDGGKGEQIEIARSNAELETLTTALNGLSVRIQRDEGELRAARDAALDTSRAKSDFLAGVSHEIRTPMNAIIGMTQIALDAESERERRQAVVATGRAANLLLRLINDILDLSKIEAGRFDIERIPFALDEVVDGLADLFAASVRERGVALLIDVAPELRRGNLVGDPLRLHQIFQNLIGNAVKFTERGEIAVRIEIVAADADGVTCGATVSDTGMGIPADRIGGLFKPFVQADVSIMRRFGGTGLGLAISKHIVEAMGGEIGVTSRIGAGSRFRFTFRLQREAAQTEPAALPPLRVLIAADRDGRRETLLSACRSLGLEAAAAEDVNVAAVYVTAGCDGRPWDMVLIAHGPAADGLGIARQLRSVDGCPPLLLVAAAAVEPSAAAAAGIRAVMERPVTPNSLRDALAGMAGLEDAPASPAPRRRAADLHAQLRHLRGRRVLLVEDNRVNQQVALHFLRRAGLAVDVADNGRVALDRLAAASYDIVLMDCNMPVMDGYEAVRLIRQDPALAGLPVVAMTANGGAEGREDSLAAGMDDHVEKPLNAEHLYRVLGQWLERPAAPDVAAPSRAAPALAPTGDGRAVDFAAALQRLGIGAEVYRNVIASFVDEWADALGDRYREAHAGGVAVRLAHTLKGAAATIGAESLRRHAQALETAARCDAAGAEVALGAVERELARVIRDLRDYLNRGRQA